MDASMGGTINFRDIPEEMQKVLGFQDSPPEYFARLVKNSKAREQQMAEQERKRAEQLERNRIWQTERQKYVLGCSGNIAADGFSGDHNGDEYHVWPTAENNLFPHHITFHVGGCDFCHSERVVLNVANAEYEYPFRMVCMDCLSIAFEAVVIMHLGKTYVTDAQKGEHE